MFQQNIIRMQHFSRIYITTWFNHRITIPCLLDKLYIIPAFVSNELFVRTNTIATLASHASWQTEIDTDVQSHDKIRHYNPSIKFKKLLNVVCTILQSLNDNLLPSIIKAFTQKSIIKELKTTLLKWYNLHIPYEIETVTTNYINSQSTSEAINPLIELMKILMNNTIKHNDLQSKIYI